MPLTKEVTSVGVAIVAGPDATAFL